MNKKICENCGKEHDGSYGSGRFCSKQCRGAFTAKMPRKHFRNEQYTCCICNAVICGRNALIRHKKEKHSELYGVSTWNKGLSKENDSRIAKQVESYRKNFENGKWIPWQKGRPLTESQKRKISKSMKKAHAEGRAHNIGECRWNNKPSWPEKWFMQVIKNEFEDKNYEREVPFYRFSLDFVWKHKKCVIEIDGEQHHKDQAQILRDKEKDKLLKKEGWKELRLDWRWVCNHTKEAIELAKNFIDFQGAASSVEERLVRNEET